MLIATEAGLEAIGIQPIVANTVTGLRQAKPATQAHAGPVAHQHDFPASGDAIHLET